MRTKHTIAGALMLCAFPALAFAKDGDIEARGILAAISSSSVTLGSTAYGLSSSTELEDRAGHHLPLSAFEVGDSVKVEARRVNGQLIARELELLVDASAPSPSPSPSPTPSVSPTPAPGNGNGEVRRSRKVKIRARLSDAVGVVTDARGQAERELEQERKKAKDSFKITVKVPVPSVIPALPSENEAANLALKATLARGGVPYALCSLSLDRFDDSDDDSSSVVAEYKVDLRSETKKNRVRSRNRKGSCDIDLSTAGDQLGIPDAIASDTVTINDGTADILVGTFAKKR